MVAAATMSSSVKFARATSICSLASELRLAAATKPRITFRLPSEKRLIDLSTIGLAGFTLPPRWFPHSCISPATQ
jgi:hypothetical protein